MEMKRVVAGNDVLDSKILIFEESPAAGAAAAPATPMIPPTAPATSAACGTGLLDTRWMPAMRANMMVDVKDGNCILMLEGEGLWLSRWGVFLEGCGLRLDCW